MKLPTFLAQLSLLLILVALQSVSRADVLPVSFTLSDAQLTVTSGGVADFTGVVTNVSGNDLSASDLFFNFSGFNASIVTPTQTLGSPDFSLPNNTYSQTVSLFTVGLSSAAVPGIPYSVNVVLEDAYGDIGTSMNVSVVTSVPEPNALTLALAGALALALPYFRCTQRAKAAFPTKRS